MEYLHSTWIPYGIRGEGKLLEKSFSESSTPLNDNNMIIRGRVTMGFIIDSGVPSLAAVRGFED